MKRRQAARAGRIIFFLYVLFMVYFLFIYMRNGSFISYNFIPFKTIKMYLYGSHYFNIDNWIVNLFGNVVAFIPLGFFVAWLFPLFARLARMTVFMLVIISVVEVLQFELRVGSFDVDDIMLNTIGGILGYLLYKALTKIYEFADEKLSIDL